jgi:hypothetical protein
MPGYQETAPLPVKILVGTVMDVLSGPRWYNVRVNDLNVPALPCRDTSSIGTGPFGPRKFKLYSPGEQVLVFVPCTREFDESKGVPYYVDADWGYILSSVDTAVGDNRYRSCDWIAPFTGADGMSDEAHRYLIEQDDKAFEDYNENQPVDAVPGSDQGVINDLGNGYGLSRFFSWIRASDIAGIWFFYFDNLTRLAAYNYEFWHSGGERWIKNDEGEVNDVDLFTPYPWESMGATESEEEISVDYEEEDGGIWIPGQTNLLREPVEADQLLLPRLAHFRGYIGDLDKDMVLRPTTTEVIGSSPDSGDKIEKYDRDSFYTGLLDITRHMNGLYAVRSAQAIIHEKYVYLPVPKQKNPPEARDWESESTGGGDGTTNYRPSGTWGAASVSNADHHKHPWRWGGRPNVWAAELYDYHAYMFNWYGVKPLTQHSRDWYLPEEGTFDPDGSGTEGAYIFSGVLDSFNFDPPDFTELQVDHRPGSTRYYHSRSVIAQLPDGSILIEDGYGSQLHMVGGNIHLTCPGDVWQRPGRSSVVWAPDDIIRRAGSSMDLTTSTGDLRMKAEKNLHILGGNSGKGGVLVESRGVYNPPVDDFEWCDGDDALIGEDVSTPGIMLLTRTGPIQMYGNDIYGKAFAGGWLSEQQPAGMWMMDDDAADNVVRDSTGANDGTYVGDTTDNQSVDGHIGKALQVDGSGKYIQLPAAIDDGLSTLAVSFWVKVLELDSTGIFIENSSGSTGFEIVLVNAGSGDVQNMEVSGEIMGSGAGTISAPTNVDLSEWTHISMTYDSSFNHRLYVNGVLVAEGTGTTAYSPSADALKFQPDGNEKAAFDTFVLSGADEGISGGSIVWDAESDRVDSAGNIHTRFANEGYLDVLNSTLCDVEELADCDSSAGPVTVNRFTSEYSYFGACDYFKVEAGDSLFRGGIVVGAGVDSVAGCDTISQANFNTLMNTLDTSTYLEEFLTGTSYIAFSTHSERLREENCESNVKGDSCFIDLLSFSLRDADQYGLDSSFVLPEARWQQIYRDESLGTTWTEPGVEVITDCSCGTLDNPSGYADITYPHPGDLWQEDERYLECDTELWDWDDTRNKDRSETRSGEWLYDYARDQNDDMEDPAETDYGPSFTARNFDANYLVSKTGI